MTDINPDQLEALDAMAGTWREQGLRVTSVPGDRTELHSGDDLVGWIEPSDRHPGMLVYQIVIGARDSGEPRAVSYPAGFLPPRPQQSCEMERRRWLPKA